MIQNLLQEIKIMYCSMGLWVIFTIDIRLCKFRIQIKYDDLYCVFVCFRHRVGLTGEIGILFIGPSQLLSV